MPKRLRRLPDTVQTRRLDVFLDELDVRFLCLQQAVLLFVLREQIEVELERLAQSEWSDFCRRSFIRLQLVPATDDGRPILDRVAGDDEVTLEPGEEVAGILSVAIVTVDPPKFGEIYSSLRPVWL